MARRIYDDPRWRALRSGILARDGYRCQIRGPKCKHRATHVDHIISVSDGGEPFDPNNLRAACASCNISKRNTEVAARARGVRAGEPVDSHRPADRHIDWSWPSLAEYLAVTGYDGPEPPGGWRPDDVPQGTPRPDVHTPW